MTLDELIAQLQAIRATVPGDSRVDIFSASSCVYSIHTYHREMRSDDVDVTDFRSNPLVRPEEAHYGRVIVELGQED